MEVQLDRYKFTYRRNRFGFWFSKTYEVVGHSYSSDQNKMILYFYDGSVREIAEWNKCEAILENDWFLMEKKNMERKAGTAIPTNN